VGTGSTDFSLGHLQVQSPDREAVVTLLSGGDFGFEAFWQLGPDRVSYSD
jgi:hypothetical protein